MTHSYVLVHHGIKGQTWGDRNGPPYPLGASSHSVKEKKAGTKGWTKKAKDKQEKKQKKNGLTLLKNMEQNLTINQIKNMKRLLISIMRL